MIAINLLPGAKKKRGGKGAGFQLPDFKALATSVKDPWLIGCVAVYAVLAVTVLAFWMPKRAQLRTIEPELNAAKREARRLQTVLRQKAETEAKRDSLLSQIEVIRAIDRERYVWPHIMDQVTRALPPYTWLDDMSARAGVEADTTGATSVAFQLSGKSADIQAVTRFVRNLEESRFLEGATLISTGAVIEQGHELTTFVLNVRYEQPDSTILTTQPLAATLVQGYRSGTARRR